MSQLPYSITDYSKYCFPYAWESSIDETKAIDDNIQKVINNTNCSREKAILALNKCLNDPVFGTIQNGPLFSSTLVR